MHECLYCIIFEPIGNTALNRHTQKLSRNIQIFPFKHVKHILSRMFPTKRRYNSANFVAFWTPFVRFSQVFCVSHYSLFQSNSIKSRHVRYVAISVYFVLFSLVHGIGMAYLSISFLKGGSILHSKHKESASMYYVKMASAIITPLIHSIVHIEALLKGSSEQQLYQSFNDIHRIFATKLHYVIDYKKLRMRYCSIYAIFLVAMVITCISFYYQEMLEVLTRPHLRIFLVVCYFITRVREYQIALILTALRETLLDLEVLLRRHQIEHNRTQRHPENIQYFRKIYSLAWSVKNSLSKCYGWTMISFLAQFTLDLIQSAYWLFINLKYFNSRNFTICE